MIVEVFNNNGQTVGFVVADHMMSANQIVLKQFPQVEKVNIVHYLPKTDVRCKQISENVYIWKN